MAKLYEHVTPEIAAWVKKQHVFFVATAPLSSEGHVNTSPKGLDCLRILGPNQVAYVDLTGSGAETIAHLRENGRIVLMFCAFTGPPKIVRLHGKGSVVSRSSPDWERWRAQFPEFPSARSVIVVALNRVSDSCGYGVPQLEYNVRRDALPRWAKTQGPEALVAFRRENNTKSIDGLPALDEADT